MFARHYLLVADTSATLRCGIGKGAELASVV